MPQYLGETGLCSVGVVAKRVGYVDSDMVTVNFNERVANTIISPASGDFVESQEVVLTSKTKDSKIYYTTDGSTPDSTDSFYLGPLEESLLSPMELGIIILFMVLIGTILWNFVIN